MKGFKKTSKVQELRPGASAKSENAKAELQLLRDKIAKLLESDPSRAQKAAIILTQWIESSSRKKAG